MNKSITKNSASIILTVLISLLLPINAFAFTDLSENHPYHDAIMTLNDSGCLKGYQDGTVKPDQSITRVEALKLLLQCLDLSNVYEQITYNLPPGSSYKINEGEMNPLSETEETELTVKVPIKFEEQPDIKFTDVVGTEWYVPVLKEAIIRELISGYQDNTVRPLKTVNKAEFFTILYRLVPESVNTVKPFDGQAANDIPEDIWFEEPFAFALQEEILHKNEDGTVNAGVELNRGHVAYFIDRYIDWHEKQFGTRDEENNEESDEEPAEVETTEEETEETEETNEENTDENGTVTFSEEGVASFYGDSFRGSNTASGELFNPDELVGAHRTLPFNTIVKVTNLEDIEDNVAEPRWVNVRIIDRGPHVDGRVIDLSTSAFEALSPLTKGLVNVRLEVVE